jgi:signal peptide peptidase SppA
MTTPSKRPAANVLAAIMCHHWAILPESLEVMVQIAERQNLDVDALEKIRGEPLDNTRNVTTRDGVATIPVTGPIFRYASLFNRISGATTYAEIATDFNAALEDPRIRALILEIDSPGGEVNGNAELAGQIFSARGRKPIAAYVSNLAGSAAYWVASAADVIVAAPTAILGSIGTVATVRKAPAPDPKQGKIIEIVSTQSPNKRLDPESDEGFAALRQTVDDIAQVFVARVAEYRGVSVETVLTDFGRGGVFVGQSAVDAGLADRLGSYESLHAELRDRGAAAVVRRPRLVASAASQSTTNSKKDTDMPDRTVPPVTPPVAPDPAATAATAPTNAVPSTPVVASIADLEAVRVAARTEERTRILAIQALGRPGEESVIAACVNDASCTAADAALRLRGAETQAAAGRLTQIKKDGDQPAPKHLATGEQITPDAANAEAAAILATHRQISGTK